MSGRSGDGIGTEFFITLTGPGADVLPWDSDRCSHAREVPCSGALGCRVDRLSAAEWHGTLTERHSHFIEYMRRGVERYLGMEGATGPDRLQYVGSWEDQQREVLHRHAVVRTARPVPAKIMRQLVKAYAHRWGFGTQFKCDPLRGGTAEAWYVAKYAAKTADSFADRPVLDSETGELKAGVRFRSWSASRHWGTTKRALGLERQVFAAAMAVAGDRQRAADAGAAGVGLDSYRHRSTTTTPVEWGVIDVLRRDLGAVLL